MKTRLKSAILYALFIILFLGLARVFPLSFSLFLLMILLIAGRELANLTSLKEEATSTERLLSYLQGGGFLIIPIYLYFRPVYSSPAYPALQEDMVFGLVLLFMLWQGGLVVLYLLASFFDQEEVKLPQISLVIIANLYLSLGLFSMNLLLWAIPFGWYILCLALLTPWISDSFAYLGGKKWGKKKLCPKLSANKTIAGALSALFMTAIAYSLIYIIFAYSKGISVRNVLLAALAGILASLICQLGDLFASALKRHKGVKDSGDLIPGHGGLIDRIDSSLFFLPWVLLISLLATF